MYIFHVPFSVLLKFQKYKHIKLDIYLNLLSLPPEVCSNCAALLVNSVLNRASPFFKFQTQVTGDSLPELERLVSALFSYDFVTISVIHMCKGCLIINDKCHFSFKIKIKLLIKLFFLVTKKFGLKKIIAINYM